VVDLSVCPSWSNSEVMQLVKPHVQPLLGANLYSRRFPVVNLKARMAAQPSHRHMHAQQSSSSVATYAVDQEVESAPLVVSMSLLYCCMYLTLHAL
jgi:hypothetical protein